MVSLSWSLVSLSKSLFPLSESLLSISWFVDVPRLCPEQHKRVDDLSWGCKTEDDDIFFSVEVTLLHVL